MAEDCGYYYYDGYDYCCRLLKQAGKKYEVDGEWVKKYCWNYGSDNCPYKKGQSSSGGCYLTTACVRAKGLLDDCDELQTLRHFRDNYMKSTPEGKCDIEHYYAVAPDIVKKINSLENASNIWKSLYEVLVVPSVAFVQAGKYEEAYTLYKKVALELENKYIVEV